MTPRNIGDMLGDKIGVKIGVDKLKIWLEKKSSEIKYK